MLDRLDELRARFQEVSDALADPALGNDVAKMTALSKEYKDLERIVLAGKAWEETRDNLQGARELLETEKDEEMRSMAKEEISELEPRLKEQEEELRQLLQPKDPNDSKNVVLEVRAGTGGDEASLFAGELVQMYERYAQAQGWSFQVTDVTQGTVGGVKEAIINISGEDVFGQMKFESGVHRVQRVPATETQGRIHTSAASVVVMPEAEEVDIKINEKDIKKEIFNSSGAGGQSVNTAYSAVRLTHIPTGISVSMQNERSQLKNLEKAWEILRTRLYDLEFSKQQAEIAAERKTLVSGGDRSAKIRTYNFPQSRVTDHRIGYTTHNLPGVMNGDLGDLIEALRIEETTNKMKGEGMVAE